MQEEQNRTSKSKRKSRNLLCTIKLKIKSSKKSSIYKPFNIMMLQHSINKHDTHYALNNKQQTKKKT